MRFHQLFTSLGGLLKINAQYIVTFTLKLIYISYTS